LCKKNLRIDMYGAQMTQSDLQSHLRARFAEEFDLPEVAGSAGKTLSAMAARASCRSFGAEPVADETLRMLCAVALSSPSKSDLQQRDIIILRDPAQVSAIKDLLQAQSWIAGAPALLVFCGNNRRQRQLHARWNRPFANDHLDAFFNASVDAGIALSAFISAAEAIGLGCCPISTIRNDAQRVSDLLGLPDHVFPVAALAVGHPQTQGRISPRLPLSVTVHWDRFDESGLSQALDDYDALRAQPGATASQRDTATFGHADPYVWSDGKTRQYATPERADFGRFIQGKGFKLD